MMTELERLPAGSRLAAIRLRSLGDCVLTTPALALLKAHRPDLQIAMVVEDRFRAVFDGNSDVDVLLQPAASAIFSWRPALALNLHGGTRSMRLTIASAARRRAGFAHHRYSFLYSNRIPRAQQILGEERTVHTAEHIASAMFWLGVPQSPIPRARLFADPALAAIGRPYAVLHPFASEAEKTWPAERFLIIAEHLKADYGLEPVFVAGPADDAGPFAGFIAWKNEPLARIKSLMAGAQLFVGNDSGPAHVAAAFGVPVVVLFGASDHVVWAPWRTEARVLTSPQGIAGIDTARVREAIRGVRGQVHA